MSQTWGIALRLVLGRMFQPSTSPPASGPSDLYSSHTAATSDEGDDEEDRLPHASPAITSWRATCSASAGITRSPYACSVASLASCCRYTANWSTPI